MSHVRYKNLGQLSMADYEVFSSIPSHPFWGQVEQHIDFSFADSLCATLYSPQGQRPYAPSLKLKIHLVQRYYNLSDRDIEERIVGDLFIKRFLGIPVAHPGIDHSTIALDRSRVGGELFHACHHYILAQALEKKLWGDKNDRWLIDAFHTYANIEVPTTYKLIQQGLLRFLRHLKKKNRLLYDTIKQHFNVGDMLKRLSPKLNKEEQVVPFSKLVATTYALLSAMEGPLLSPLFWGWVDRNEQLRSLELQALLIRILMENTKEADPKDSQENKPTTANKEKKTSVELVPQTASELTPPTALQMQEQTANPTKSYVKDDSTKDRVVSAFDPDVRHGAKSSKVKFAGDKVQVVESSQSRLILNAEPFAGNEPDADSLISIQQDIVLRHGVRPKESVADSAYGYAKSRIAMEKLEIPLTTPLAMHTNPTGLYDQSKFLLNSETNKMICPAGKESMRISNSAKLDGKQYIFDKKICNFCEHREQCTTSKTTGRTVFMSDNQSLYDEAQAYNESEAGKEALQARYEIERTNNEMKNHHGLKHPRTRGREPLRITVKLTTIIINLKVIVKTCGEKARGFLRQKSRVKNKALVCS